jgi:hypothetical protein
MPSLLIKRPLTSKATKKQSLLRSNLTNSVLITLGDSDVEIEFDDALQVSRKRPELSEPFDDDAELSDYVKLRLAIARLRAVEHAKKAWGHS